MLRVALAVGPAATTPRHDDPRAQVARPTGVSTHRPSVDGAAPHRIGAVALSLAIAAALMVVTAGRDAAQNLVSNPSFETFTGIPSAYGQVYLAPPWSSPTLSSPYYYLDDVSVTLPAPPCLTPPPDMVAWYPLDELTGATVVDDIAPAPGSLVNNAGTSQPGPVAPPGPGSGPAPVVGQVAGAHYFHPGHFHTVPPQAELDFGTGSFSIDAWIRAVGNGPVAVQSIVDKLDIPGGNVGFALYIQDRFLNLNVNGSTFTTASQITGGNPLANTGPWYHVAATVDRGTGAGTLYINGVPSLPTFVPPAASVTNGLPLWIGETRLPGSVGEIAVDELEIFNRALTPTEVTALFAAGPAGKCKLRSDLGDAPDSTNHVGTTMTSYAIGNFPTVYDPPSPGPSGPLHLSAKGLLWLGRDVSFEGEADLGWDQDPTTNLLASASPPTADHDLLDDGVAGVPLPDCAVTQFPLSASSTASGTVTGYVNVWFDWTRDGDWDDMPRCAVAPNIDAIASEWAVQNQAVSLAPGFSAGIPSTPFRSVNPVPGAPTWMRITLTDAPIYAAAHGGPFPNPADLGRGGSGPVGGYPYGETEDHLVNVPSGRAEICVLKFNDLDGDGVQDAGEVGLPGWHVDILDAGGNAVTTLVTGPQGLMCVGVPAPAPYTVAEVLQPGWSQTFPALPGTHTVTVAPGQLLNLSFGNRKRGGRIHLPAAVRVAAFRPGPLPMPTTGPTTVPTVPGISTPSPDDTPVATAFSSPTATATPEATRPASATPSVTARDTATATAQPSHTPTPVATTPSPTSTPTVTQTATPSPTPTLTPSLTPSLTPTTVARPTTPPSPTPGCAPRPAGMTAWWPLDELSGTTANDVLGSAGHHGITQGGAVVLNPAKVAAGRAFDGTSGYILVPHDAALDPGSGDFSIDAWIRPDALDGRRPIVTKIYAPADAPLGYTFTLEDGNVSLAVSNEGSAVIGTAPMPVPADGQWHLVAATLERGSATGGRLYLDGSLIHMFDTTPLVGALDTAAELRIAGLPVLGRGSPERFFSGGIDEVEIFNRGLTAVELGAIYTAGGDGKCDKPGPVRAARSATAGVSARPPRGPVRQPTD
jgi:hypothetical protein